MELKGFPQFLNLLEFEFFSKFDSTVLVLLFFVLHKGVNVSKSFLCCIIVWESYRYICGWPGRLSAVNGLYFVVIGGF